MLPENLPVSPSDSPSRRRHAVGRAVFGLAVTALAGFALTGCGRNGVDSAPFAPAPGVERGVVGIERARTDAILGFELVIRLRPGVNRLALFQEYGVDPQEVLSDGLTWRVTVRAGVSAAGILTAAREDERIELVEQNISTSIPESAQSSVAFSEGIVPPEDFWDQTVARRLDLAQAHSVTNGAPIIVAVLDTGINREHPLFKGHLLADGYDFIDHDGDTADLPDGVDNDNDGLTDEAAGHGCHVAGLVLFVAPGARILPVRVLNSGGTGTAYAVARGIESAVDRGARVINMSLTMATSSAVVFNAIAYATSKNVIMVCAAGNDGGANPLSYPANDGRVWAVGALDAQNNLAAFSAPSSGVVLAAPGEHLLSAYWDGGYASWSGTSMSAPLVAGTAALVLAQYRWTPPAGVLAMLQTSAVPIVAGGVTNPYGVGAGLVARGSAVGAFAAGPGILQGNTEIKVVSRR